MYSGFRLYSVRGLSAIAFFVSTIFFFGKNIKMTKDWFSQIVNDCGEINIDCAYLFRFTFKRKMLYFENSPGVLLKMFSSCFILFSSRTQHN